MVPMNLRLFCGEYNKPVKPKVGLEIGQQTYSDSQIKLWINLYCFFLRTKHADYLLIHAERGKFLFAQMSTMNTNRRVKNVLGK